MDNESNKIIKEMLESIKIDYKMDDSLVKLAKADDDSIQSKVTEDLKKKIILQANSNKLKEIKPYVRDSRDKQLTIYKYKLELDYRKSQLTRPGCSMRSTCITNKQYSSHRHLNELRPISLKEMKVNEAHLGHYLECKTIAEPFYLSGICCLVEDKHGDVEFLIWRYFNTKSYETDPNSILPIGTRLFIKEPFLTLFACEDKEFGIRVDSPTDLVIVNQADGKKPVEKLIDEANSLFQRNKYYSAFLIYSQAVQLSDNKSVRALLNRSAACLKLEKYNQAFLDAQLVTQLEASNEKAFFRMAKAAYSMRKFGVAKQSFQQCLLLNKENKEAQLELEKSNERHNESLTGSYDFKQMMQQYLTKQCLFFDIADYQSDKIAVSDIANKAKGVVAVDDIPKGTLLIVSKAVTAAFNKKNPIDYSIKVNFLNNNCDLNDGAENFRNLIYKMQNDPELAKKVYGLYAGPNYDRNEQCSGEFIDIERIEGIQRLNTFFIEKDFDLIETETKSLFNQESGVWLFPSYLNHSCVGNAIRFFLGDVIVIYAKKNIQKNEEITIKYFSGDYAERVENALKVHNFKCDCRMCELDSRESNEEMRKIILNEINEKKKNSKMSLNEAIEYVELMKKTYGQRTEYLTSMIVPLQNLALNYRENSKLKESARTFEQVYEITKVSNCLIAIDSLKEASFDYKILGKKDKANWCIQTAKDYFQNNNVFFERFWFQ